MSRKLSEEQLAKREALKNRTTEEVYQDAVKRGLESNVAAERVAAIKAYADEHNPNLTEMKDKVKQAEDRAAKAEANLAAVVSERDTAQAILVIATQAALQGTTTKAELAELRMNFDSKIVEARKELVSSAQEHEWRAIRAENSAKDTLKEAQSQFGARGQQTLLDEVKRIFEENHIAEPEDLTKLPAGISPLFLTLFGHSAVRAQLMLAYSKSFPEPSENFKQALLRVLRTGQLQLEGMRKPDPIPDLDVKREVLTAMAVKWNVLNEVQRIADNEDVQCRADFLRTHYADLAAAQHASSLRGEGRTPISVEAPVSVTGYTGPHDQACCCGKPGCNPLPPHLRVDTWLGTRQTEKIEDINARHEVDTTFDYGQQLIEREALAKKGKIVAVLPPESMAQSRTSLDDNEGEELS